MAETNSTQPSLFKNLGSDLPAGLVVFLVALPLCLGIALASGAPLFSGLVAGIIGGIVIGTLSGSHTSVSGPAAGLAIIVLEAITDLGFETFLLAGLLAGIIQFLLGIINAGIIGLFFPVSVIRGMLAAIGVTLILKQIPHFLGFDKEAFGNMGYNYEDLNTFTELWYAIVHFEVGPTIVGVLALVIIIVFELPQIKKQKWAKILPGALVAVLVGIGLNAWWLNTGSPLAISDEHLVQIPRFDGFSDFASSLRSPNFGSIGNINVWVTALVLTIIGSLETLLSLEAVDKIDPHRRNSPKNRELRAQGIGNSISALLGGLPITAVIVRSSANIAAGAQTKLSAIIHGVLLMGTVILIPNLLNLIPLSTLAAVLLFVGFKLSKPSLYINQYKMGFAQFFPFLSTIVVVIFTDLLTGIAVGMVLAFYFILQSNFRIPAYESREVQEKDGKLHITIRLNKNLSFLNKASLQAKLDEIPPDSYVEIIVPEKSQMDHDVLSVIAEFSEDANERHLGVRVHGLPKDYLTASH